MIGCVGINSVPKDKGKNTVSNLVESIPEKFDFIQLSETPLQFLETTSTNAQVSDPQRRKYLKKRGKSFEIFFKPKEILQTHTPCNQQSIIDIESEDLALSPKSVQLVESSDGRVCPLNLSSEMRPTTSESKIPHSIVDGDRYDDLKNLCLGKEKPSIKKTFQGIRLFSDRYWYF